MWGGFGESLSFELDCEEEAELKIGGDGGDGWRTERRVRVYDDEGEFGDSCCFGTRTVKIGRDSVWKLHGGV